VDALCPDLDLAASFWHVRAADINAGHHAELRVDRLVA